MWLQYAPKNRQVFLCYASEDRARVTDFYHLLQNAGFDPWLDKESLLPGQRWREEIPRAIREAAVIVVFLSNTSVNKRGYVQREFKLALDTVEEIPQGQVFLIPVKLDDCQVPDAFSQFQWSALYEPEGTTKVLESIRHQTELPVIPSQYSSHQSVSNSPSPAQQSPDTTILETLYSEAINGQKPGTRQHAIRSLVRHFGVGAAERLRELTWSSRYSATRCEAIEQVAFIEARGAVGWLKEVAEQHPDKACRAKAARLVIEIEGLNATSWLEGVLAGERQWIVTYTIGHSFYRTVESLVGNVDLFSRDAAIVILERILARPIEGTPRECLLAATLILMEHTDEAREWAISIALGTRIKWSRAKCLAIVLRCWPECMRAMEALKSLSAGSEDTVARDHARAYLKYIQEKKWSSVDDSLGLGKRFA